MKCYNHSDREAVATCKFCGKALCHREKMITSIAAESPYLTLFKFAL